MERAWSMPYVHVYPGLPVLDALTAKFGCTVNQLSNILAHPLDRDAASELLRGQRLRTTYKSRLGEYAAIVCHSVTDGGVDQIPSHEGKFGIKVLQYFLCRHNIELKYKTMPCVAVAVGKDKNHFKYYPLELLVYN